MFVATLPVIFAQTRTSPPASPYGGTTVEEIVARVNDQIISSSDYERAMQEMDQEERQHGASMQQISEAHKDLLRNLIDQQLWLSKGKELGVTGETELVNRLNEIRKQYNLNSLEDLEKAAHDQGVSYEDFKANIRNQIITQQVMRDEVGRRINMTPGEVQRYFEEHKQDYVQQESVKLSEILVSTGAGSTPAQIGGPPPDDPQKLADAQAKANDIEAKLRAGGDFAQLARTSSDGTTASEGGDLGTYKRGQLGSVFEDATFPLKVGDVTEPIRTKQGFVILKVVAHTQGGVPAFKDVESDVEQNFYMSRMEPAIRDYLTKMRDDASIEIKTGYVDTGASPNKQIFPISYSTYTPPSSKKKHKVERTRFRETTHGFRQKTKPGELASNDQAEAPPAPVAAKSKKKTSTSDQTQEKPGKKEKIRFGQAPTKTLPSTPASQTEDAGAGSTETANAANEPANPLETSDEPKKKSRFSDRSKQPKQPKVTREQQREALNPQAPDAAEVADRQTQSSALGLNGDQANKKKKKNTTTTGEKTRLSDHKKTEDTSAPVQPTPVPPVAGAPAPAQTPSAPAPQQQQ
ncbi:MAG TPA: peptidylprolyl isomerase [Terracidiphilus sp.]|nr:peptidylprolyl isomerase [Terracidiphilus sp.]